ncbi:hypothetical protein L6452_02684 [Arctium lappa]|uniref:Uncharacterized protein n=1 Tax=Arctium lappa TaxID=4217 RepID=A0ACB9FJL1_ARCLA|nr:hypothetical protein L6452_02684 [Arctium lappa]
MPKILLFAKVSSSIEPPSSSSSCMHRQATFPAVTPRFSRSLLPCHSRGENTTCGTLEAIVPEENARVTIAEALSRLDSNACGTISAKVSAIVTVAWHNHGRPLMA